MLHFLINIIIYQFIIQLCIEALKNLLKIKHSFFYLKTQA